MTKPLMPMATAVWLVDNTSLSFRQIGRFCELHVLEVQAIADETVAQTIVGQDPTLSEQLTRAEIERCQNDPAADLQLVVDEVPAQLRTKGPRYTPVSKRQDKPDAIAWILRHHPELSDAQIGRLIGTTKPTIEAIRSRSHWNIQNIQPKDPVSFGLCSQKDLDETVSQARAKAAKNAPPAAEEAPADEAPSEAPAAAKTAEPPAPQAKAPPTPAAEEPEVEEPAAEEAPADEAPSEAPAAEEAPADEAPSEAPAAAEVEKPAAAEPAGEPTEEPPAAEPVEQPAEQPDAPPSPKGDEAATAEADAPPSGDDQETIES